MDQIRLDILNFNYWETLSYLKSLSFIYDPSHPKRVKLEKECNSMITEINTLKKKIEHGKN